MVNVVLFNFEWWHIFIISFILIFSILTYICLLKKFCSITDSVKDSIKDSEVIIFKEKDYI